MPLGVRGAVGIQALRSLSRRSRLAPHGRDRIDDGQKLGYVMSLGGRDLRGQRSTPTVGHDVVFRACFTAIHGVGPGRVPQKTARTEVESTAARAQSIWSAWRSRSSNALWMRSQTPTRSHSASPRQHVMPDPQPSPCGKSSHAMPVSTTKRIPVSTARLGSGLRPGLSPTSAALDQGFLIFPGFPYSDTKNWHYIDEIPFGICNRWGRVSPGWSKRIFCALSGWTTHRSLTTRPSFVGITTSVLRMRANSSSSFPGLWPNPARSDQPCRILRSTHARKQNRMCASTRSPRWCQTGRSFRSVF